MFKAILTTQWKWSRGAVLTATILGFAIPLASLQSANSVLNAFYFTREIQGWSFAYPLLAAGVGLAVALIAWRYDHHGRHVYALSLPVSRARYAALRFGAGATFLLPPVLGVLLGALLVAVSGTIPEGLHAYPFSLTFRFALAAGVAYALFFAISSSTSKIAGVVLGTLLGIFFAQYLLSAFGGGANLLLPIRDFIFFDPGLLSVFSGRWTLIDA